MVVPDDEGASWRYRGGIIFKNGCFNEHSVVELADGRLCMLDRCKKETTQSFSADGGKTWQPQSTTFPHVNSKSVIRRLQSGNLLVVRHGQDITTATPERQELSVFLTTDEGKTWAGTPLLEERLNVSHPDIAQDTNGDIYVDRDRERYDATKILFRCFREQDLKSGTIRTPGSSPRNLVKSKAGMIIAAGR